MSTVAQVIDRILRDWLNPPDDQPIVCTLNGTITDSATSLTIDDTLLSPEEKQLLGPGSLIEIDSEQIRVGDFNEDTNVASSCVREANGTTKAAHDDGAEVTLSPTWSRKTVFDAVGDEVETLWPDLYATAETTALTLSATSVTEVPAAVMEPIMLWAKGTGESRWSETAVSFLDHFPPSSTGKAIETGISGSGYLVYKKKFTRPALESDSMSTLGIEDEWERLVIIGTVAYLVGARDLTPAHQEYLTEQLQIQGFPVDSARRIREGLLRYEALLLAKAKSSLRARHRTPVATQAAF